MRTVALIIQVRAVTAGFKRQDPTGHNVKCAALSTGMERGFGLIKLKRFVRHKSFDVPDEYLELSDLFNGHPLSGML